MAEATTAFFVAEGDHLVAQALLLAHSLRNHQPDFAQIAYCPAGPETLPPEAREAFAAMGVQLRPLPVPEGLWKKPYPHGNKILACAQPRPGTGRHLFLDSDMVCAAPLGLSALWRPGRLHVVPEGVPSWGKDNDRWPRAYAHFGLDLPAERVRLTRRRRREFLPYFNAGLVGWDNGCAAGGRGWPELWLDTARQVDWDLRIARKRPWLDQIALPLALYRFGLGYEVLPDSLNFSISDRAHEPEARPRLIHYHSFRYGPQWPQFRDAMAAFRAEMAPGGSALARRYGGFWDAAPEPADPRRA